MTELFHGDIGNDKKKEVLLLRKIVLLSLLFFILLPNSKHAGKDTSEVADALLTSLAPVITEQVHQYYGYEKQYNLYDTKIKKLKRDGYHLFIKLEVTTFEDGQLPPYGQDDIKLDLTPLEAKVIAYKHKGDEEEKKINKFYRIVTKDIEHSFKKKWRNYQQTRFNEFQYLAGEKGWDDCLLIVSQLVKDMKDETTLKYKNTIQPLVYFNEEEVLILYKDKDGMNEIISIKNSSNEWKEGEREQKQGKKMTKQILSHM